MSADNDTAAKALKNCVTALGYQTKFGSSESASDLEERAHKLAARLPPDQLTKTLGKEGIKRTAQRYHLLPE